MPVLNRTLIKLVRAAHSKAITAFNVKLVQGTPLLAAITALIACLSCLLLRTLLALLPLIWPFLLLI